MNRETLLILDCGSKYAQLLATFTRKHNIFSVVRRYDTPISELDNSQYHAIIFAGADCEKAPVRAAIEKIEASGWDKKVFLIGENDQPDFSKIPTVSNFLLKDIKNEESQSVLKSFLFDSCGFTGNWTIKAFVAESIENIKKQIGDKRVICALSGGVDSSVAAALVSSAVGSQLTCIFVDHGMLRKNEGDKVENEFVKHFPMNFIRVNAEARFLGKLAGVDDPEKKRKIIGGEFISLFEEEAKKLGQIDFLVQGTIYPDIIESGNDGEVAVKSHHNVGGLPERMSLDLCEPLKDLFKGEVRLVGEELGLPKHLVWRQPCPGPALGVRCVGEVTKHRLDILRDADDIFCSEIEKAGLNAEISQYFAVITDMKSVGVTDGKRTYDYTVALRAIKTDDFMTAKWYHIPMDLLELVSTRICSEVARVNRVVYDITSKPPATIEWE